MFFGKVVTCKHVLSSAQYCVRLTVHNCVLPDYIVACMSHCTLIGGPTMRMQVRSNGKFCIFFSTSHPCTTGEAHIHVL